MRILIALLFGLVVSSAGFGQGQSTAPAPNNSQSPNRPQRLKTELTLEEYIPIIALMVLLLAGAVVLALVHRWFKRTQEEEVLTADQLTEFRRLKAEGLLSDEEFAKVRGILGEKLREEVGLAGTPKLKERSKQEEEAGNKVATDTPPPASESESERPDKLSSEMTDSAASDEGGDPPEDAEDLEKEDDD